MIINASSADLRRTLGLQTLRGRWFDDEERAAVVNESLAARDLGGRDPVGTQVRLERDGPLFTIVGVVEDLKHSQLDAPAGAEIYVPVRTVEGAMYDFTTLILAAHSPEALAPDLRAVVAAIDPTQIPFDVMTLEQRLTQSIAPRRVNLLLIGVFAAVALLLAVLGTYGVLAYSVAQRVPEIGVRMALGATRAGVAVTIVREGMMPTLCGLAAGVVGALPLTNAIQGLLYDVRATDPWTFAVVTAALAVVALTACLTPALKAASIDPAIVLRDE